MPAAAADVSFGIIITNRDRPTPLAGCLVSLAAQTVPPAWVAIADLGSNASNAAALSQLARRHGVSYVRIEHHGPWNQALAFNTALRHMPTSTHAVQLDADMILHPDLLRLAQHSLSRCDALAAVPSYVAAAAIPPDYSGTIGAFRSLAARAFGGNPLSRGGFTAIPRSWLFEHGAYDEAYVGWGFEDADLWWRLGSSMTQYCEATGSFLLHQSHPRQPAAGDAANPNRARYARRLRDAALTVNPNGWGLAEVPAVELRPGIARRSRADGIRFTGAPVRQFRDGRLRPVADTGEADSIDVSVTGSDVATPSRATAVSVVLLVQEPDPQELAAALRGFGAQRPRPIEVLVADCGSSTASARATQAAVQRAPGSRYLWGGAGDPTRPAQTLNSALQRVDQRSEHVLLLGGPQWLAPDGLARLASAMGNGRCFVHGAAHAVPPIALGLDLLTELDWETWASVASIDPRIGRWWHFAETAWLLRRGLYDQRLDGDRWITEAVRRAARAGDAAAGVWTKGWVVSLACMRQEPFILQPGSEEAALAAEA